MKNAIIVHGMPSKKEYYNASVPSGSNFHRVPWLQKQLIVKDREAFTPEMFHAYNPQYDIWKREFERFDVNTETVLVGHSCGGGFLLRWLSEHQDVNIKKLVLVAPWIDRSGWLHDDNDFFDFSLDRDLAQRVDAGIHLLESTDDMSEVQDAIHFIKDGVDDLMIYTFENYGHFCESDLGGKEFPELLDIVLGE